MIVTMARMCPHPQDTDGGQGGQMSAGVGGGAGVVVRDMWARCRGAGGGSAVCCVHVKVRGGGASSAGFAACGEQEGADAGGSV